MMSDGEIGIEFEGSPERLKVEVAGWQVAEDGMEIVL